MDKIRSKRGVEIFIDNNLRKDGDKYLFTDATWEYTIKKADYRYKIIQYSKKLEGRRFYIGHEDLINFLYKMRKFVNGNRNY